jgi:hypothetical protein
MADYVLQTVNLDVFGGPTSLEVSADFGKDGVRGSRIWTGVGSPTQTLTNQPVALYDLYINTNSTDQFYSWLYQYVPEIGNPTWQRVLKLNPQQFSKVYLVSFLDGQGTVDIPLSTITADTTANISQFIIRNSFENNSLYPVASSFTYSIETISSVKFLRINFGGVLFDGTDWTELSGSHKVHLFVSYLS